VDAMEELVRFAHERLEPFEDGTPLSSAINYGGFLAKKSSTPSK
jgi:hypothetical protein